MQDRRTIQTTACVVGGGPAGMMLGYLLARAGIDVVVLEKHGDFLRDFRGDTIHPSTLELMAELGLLEEFLMLPHQELAQLSIAYEGTLVAGPDFSHLPVKCPFIALMPQWDFLNFLVAQASRYAGFDLHLQAEVTELVEQGGRITGVLAKTATGVLQVKADLVFGTDGRHSTTRDCGGFEVHDFGVPIDVLWFRVRRGQGDPDTTLGRIGGGRALVTIYRGDYYQCGYIIRKGTFDELKQQGIAAFRESVVTTAPFLSDTVGEVEWDKVRLLTVQVNRLRRWCRPGLLCIGDAAHAMSPAGGVGINLAIQDAVAAANLLTEKLRQKRVELDDLHAVQERREWPVKIVQAMQVFIHRRMFPGKADSARRGLTVPWVVRKLIALAAPLMRRVAARVIGIGFRPEHIHTPDCLPAATLAPRARAG